jgi:hypothetical protein
MYFNAILLLASGSRWLPQLVTINISFILLVCIACQCAIVMLVYSVQFTVYQLPLVDELFGLL